MLLRILAFALLFPLTVSAADINVAAASDLNFAMRELAAEFTRTSGTRVVVSYGSSGNFYSQIQGGAPFDVFMSADAEYPARLVQAGVADPSTVTAYARGAIVLWVPASSKLDPASMQFRLLLDPSVTRVAIANPKHAPYGRAAEAALRSAGVYEQVAPKLVLGENISQAAQFVQTGNAQAGIVALSLALAPGMREGKYWQIPQSAHAPLNQAAVVLNSTKNAPAARAFVAFLKSPAARAIFQRYGFRDPEAKP